MKTARTALDLKLGSFFKFCYLSALACLLPLSVFFGILGAGGADTVRLNGRPVHGFTAVVVAALLPFLMALIATVWLTLGALFLRLFNEHGPRLRFKSDEPVPELIEHA